MQWSYYISYFFGGAFFANAIPHLVSGMMGRAFQSPFSKPPGKGLSSSTVNVLWGWFNIALGYFLIFQVGKFDLREIPQVAVIGIGAFLISFFSARQFGRLHGGNSP
jgi:hypothetical protein